MSSRNASTRLTGGASGSGEGAPPAAADVVMCTHGRGGLHDIMFGRIAQQVVGLGTTPILLIPPSMSGAAPTFTCKRMLVTLDGNLDHEEGLNVAASLAKICGAELILIMVVQKYNTLSGEEAQPQQRYCPEQHIYCWTWQSWTLKSTCTVM